MNRDDIIRMAQEASILGDFDSLVGEQWRQDTIRDLERFAILVAAAEREACAKLAFNAKTYIEAAAAIRARGQA